MTIKNLQPLAYAINIVFFSLGTASFFLRLYCRAFLVKSLGWDDASAVFLLAVNTTQQAIQFILLHYGCGKHSDLLTAYQLEQILKWVIVDEVFYTFTHWSIKQTFLFFYLRLSPSAVFRRYVIGTMILNTIFTLVIWMLAFLQCVPFDAIFHRALYPNAKCINPYIILILPSVLNVITDFIILGLPIPTVWKLQMSLRRKIAVLSVIGFGASSVIVNLFRFILMHEFKSTSDLSYLVGKTLIVCALEIQLAVIAANLPSIKSLWVKITGGSSAGQSGRRSGSKGIKLSSLGRDAGRVPRSECIKPKLVPGSVTQQVSSIIGSEEELWSGGQQGPGSGDIIVTTAVAVTRAMKSESDEELIQERYNNYRSPRESPT